eukprot:4393251-Pleurochrysis_carterae.AAC.2
MSMALGVVHLIILNAPLIWARGTLLRKLDLANEAQPAAARLIDHIVYAYTALRILSATKRHFVQLGNKGRARTCRERGGGEGGEGTCREMDTTMHRLSDTYAGSSRGWCMRQLKGSMRAPKCRRAAMRRELAQVGRGMLRADCYSKLGAEK